MRAKLVAAAVVVALAPQLSRADCADSGNSLAVYEMSKQAVALIQVDGAGVGCSGTGTGFFVASGVLVTAGHVIPDHCSNPTIRGHSEELGTFDLELVPPRSFFDIALLRANVANSTSLRIVRPIADAKKFEFQTVTIVSADRSYPHPVPTSARIDSTVVANDANKWGLCATAANPGRSGSPVLLADGSVVAVFIERPADGFQDIARVLPLAVVDDMPQLLDAALGLSFTDGAGDALDLATLPGDFVYSFEMSHTIDTHRMVGDGTERYLYIGDEGRFVPIPDVDTEELLFMVLFNDAKIRHRTPIVDRFEAAPGYRFDAGSIELKVASVNPPATPLPTAPCTSQLEPACYVISADSRTIELRYGLFAGPILDTSRGWLSGSLYARQVMDAP